MRCMSMPSGSATSAARCKRMPTWRWSRTACCAAATDFGRPSVIGSTKPGNNTTLRTGTTMSASAGSGGNGPVPGALASLAKISGSATAHPCFLQRNDKATGDHGAAHIGVTAGRQPDASIEPPLRQLEPMNDRGAPFGRHGTGAGDDEVAILDDGLRAVGIDAGQRDQRQNLVVGLQ